MNQEERQSFTIDNLMVLHRHGVTHVQLNSSVECCPTCDAFHGRGIPIDRAMSGNPIPEYCKREGGCICSFVPILENRSAPTQVQLRNTPIKAKEHPQYSLFIVLAILIPIIGFALGIIKLCQQDPLDRKLGETTIITAIVTVVICTAVVHFFSVALS